MIVVDVNFLIHFFFPSDFSPITEKVFLKDPVWISPLLWRSEFRNVLLGFVRKNIIDYSKAIEGIEKAEIKMQGAEHPVSSSQVMDLGRSSNCSAYDCEYVALAKTKELILLTWDARILRAFPEFSRNPEKYLENTEVIFDR
ncbi:MAG: type II toxin-antitoxin system VapC family toxin [Candidatus Riflebacteria bacterium]|nr:type II toxin-antitoxin system VapC family toxin [Candidatus Riflebacteria bacterium]